MALSQASTSGEQTKRTHSRYYKLGSGKKKNPIGNSNTRPATVAKALFPPSNKRPKPNTDSPPLDEYESDSEEEMDNDKVDEDVSEDERKRPGRKNKALPKHINDIVVALKANKEPGFGQMADLFLELTKRNNKKRSTDFSR